LIEAGNRGWSDSLILSAFGVAAVLAVAFVVVESRTEKPMVPLRFFRSSTFTGANIDAFSISFLIAGVAFFMTLYQQNVHGFSAVKTGLALLPMVITMMIMSPITGGLVNRVGSRRLISLGMLVTGVGTLLLMRSGAHASYMDIVPGFVLMGLGMSGIWAPMTTAVLNSVETEKSGVASAVNGAIREIGTAFGIALLGTIMNRTYQNHYNADASVQGLRNDPSLGPLQPVINQSGSGASFAGHVVDGFGLSNSAAVSQLREASAQAFVVGMDRAILISAFTIVVASALSYVLVKDNVFEVAAEREPELEASAADAEPELVAAD
jgi:Na+/melibiose symporter-like transporter